MRKIFNIRKLSNEFYKEYPLKDYPELEQKRNRPYVVLIVNYLGMKFAIPLRTSIKHKFAYIFKNTGRSTCSKTGIDYSKAIVVENMSYLGEKTNIDNLEYIEINYHQYFILEKFKRYVDGYIDYRKNKMNRNYSNKYAYSTLKYFDHCFAKFDYPYAIIDGVSEDLVINIKTKTSDILNIYLKRYKMTEEELAKGIHVPKSRINKLMKNKAKIDAEMSLRLGKYFGLPDGFFYKAQNSIEFIKAKLKYDKCNPDNRF